MDVGPESIQILTKTYRDKALHTFIRGLNGELPKLLGIKEPTDLPQALQLCMKLQNQNFRTQHAFSYQPSQRKLNTPHIPPKKPQPFFPNLAYLPQPTPYYGQLNSNRNTNNQYPLYQRNSINQNPTNLQYRQNLNYPQNFAYPHRPTPRPNYFNNPPPRPTQPKPPVPMDVDQSQRTKNINYMNRPTNNPFAGKRPIVPSHQMHQPFKQQRVNHIEPVDDTLIDSGQSDQGQNEQSWEDYYQQYASQDNIPDEDTNEFSDIHFLG